MIASYNGYRWKNGLLVTHWLTSKLSFKRCILVLNCFNPNRAGLLDVAWLRGGTKSARPHVWKKCGLIQPPRPNRVNQKVTRVSYQITSAYVLFFPGKIVVLSVRRGQWIILFVETIASHVIKGWKVKCGDKYSYYFHFHF